MVRYLISAFLIVSCQSALATSITATAIMDYGQEVTPSNATPSTATGTATIIFDDVAGTLDLAAEITGISLADVTLPSGGLAFGGAGPFHIHNAPPGANGDIVVAFPDSSYFSDVPGGLSVTANDVAFDTGILAALLDGDLYLNLHTQDYASGEIRGQLSAVPIPAPLALLLLPLGMLARMKKSRS